MGSIYAQRGGGAGSAYANPGTVGAPAAVEKKKGHGLLSRLGSDLASAAIHAPAGVYAVSRALGHDIIHGPGSPWAEKGARSHLVDIAAGSGKQVAAEAEHPLRHPGYTLLDLLAVSGAAAGTAARVGKASEAARAGEGAAGAARAAARRPVYPARTLKRGALKVNVGSSQSPLGASGQRLSDAALQRAAGRAPKTVAGRAVTSAADRLLTRKIGKAVTAETRTVQDVHRGAGAALIALGRKLKPAEQKALQVVAEEAPLHGRIAAAEARVAGAAGKLERRRQQAELDLLHKAAVHVADQAGRPVFAGAHAAKLGRVLDRMREVAAGREDLLKGLGVLTDEAVQRRKTSAGRVALGARYEKPTAGKLGIPSRALKREQSRLGSLRSRQEKTLTREARYRADLTAKQQGLSVSAPERVFAAMTEEQAHARLDRLDKRYEQLLAKIAPQVNPYSAEHAAAETRSRNTARGRMAKGKKPATGKSVEGRMGGGSATIKTISQEVRDLAETKLAQIVEKYPEHPVARQAAELIRERDQLRALVNRRGEAGIAGEAPPPLPKIEQPVRPSAKTELVGKPVPEPSNPYRNRLVRLGLALEEQQKRVGAMEKQAAARVAPTGFQGAEHFNASPQAVRIPDVAKKAPRSLGRPSGSVGAQGTLGHLRGPGSVTHEYTGALREHALRRQDTAQLVGESSLEAAKFAGLRHVHDLVRTAATPAPTSASDIAVRLDNLRATERMPAEVRRFLDDPEEFFKTAAAREQASAFDQLRARLFINPKTLDAEQAAEFARLQQEGKVGWVPKRVLGELAHTHLPHGGAALGTVDAINNASRFAILYLKPAYAIPNLLGNAALTILQQGFAAVPNVAHAARLDARLGPELAARIDTLVGEGFARAISAHGEGVGRRVVDRAAQFWSKGVDQPFRRASFLFEAKRAGYSTPGQLEQLLTNPAHVYDLVDVTQRANRELIDYSNLGPTEREVIRRVVFFYPWVKGSTVYAGRLLREHPVKAAATGELGREGQQFTDQTVGAVPSYLEGVFPIGGRLVNPSAAAIQQTPAQVGLALAGLAGGDVGQVGQLSNFLSPASSLALAAVERRDRAGYPYPAGTNLGGIAVDQLVRALPQFVLAQRISDAQHHRGADRLYPPNTRDALLQFLVGGIAPRRYNKGKLADLAANERSRYVP